MVSTGSTLAPEIKKYEPQLALLTPNRDAGFYYTKLDKQITALKKKLKFKHIYTFYEKID